jgi:MFS family permease
LEVRLAESVSINSTEDSTTDDDDDDSLAADLEILDSKEFTEVSALMVTRNSRASYSAALHRPSAILIQTVEEGKGPTEQADTKKHAEEKGATISSLMANSRTRAYLVSYWFIAFTNVAASEAFPLFAMSKVGGLGIEEKMIGAVGTMSGLMYCIGQYFIFTTAMKRYGLVQALRYGALWSNLPIIFFPLSLYMTGWLQLVYLSLLSGMIMIANSVFLACTTIGANRTVEASHRAAMNGLSSIGTSVGRGGGPIFAGFLVAGAMTSGVVPPEFGGWVVYIVLAISGMIAYTTTLSVKEEE